MRKIAEHRNTYDKCIQFWSSECNRINGENDVKFYVIYSFTQAKATD